jgi:hypothetical protein
MMLPQVLLPELFAYIVGPYLDQSDRQILLKVDSIDQLPILKELGINIHEPTNAKIIFDWEIKTQNIAMIEYLCSLGLNLKIDPNYEKDFVRACASGNLDLIKCYINHGLVKGNIGNQNVTDKDSPLPIGWMALQSACQGNSRANRFAVIEYLLESGFAPEFHPRNYYNSLRYQPNTGPMAILIRTKSGPSDQKLIDLFSTYIAGWYI